MLPGMYFVYALSCDNSVFYIGMTKNIAVRYSMHINATGRAPVNAHIRQLRRDNKIITFKIIDYLPKLEASELERYSIYLFSRAGHALLNEHYKPFIMPDEHDFSNTSQTIKYLKHKQQIKEHTHCCLNGLDYEQATSK